MANKDWAFGLQPVTGPGGGSPETIRFPLKRAIQATTPQTITIYKGQPLLWQSTIGFVTGTGATNSSDVIGVAAEYYSGSAMTKTDIAAWSARNHKFLIQSDGTTTTGVNRTSYLMKNYAWVGATGGSTATGLSSLELDYSSGDITGTAQPLKVIDFRLGPGENYGSHVNCVVEFVHGFDRETDVTVT